ncbi:kinesin-like protein klp-3 [Cynoglossus semilaevis]|uniref:kinesin-like protein klp-3 n=1 Tax=Cynoglossus semilaevis TaxID=244447 RepID=UPI000D628253|nr:kinesin-like protein klp-3 [Cynoglossus semilaevis]
MGSGVSRSERPDGGEAEVTPVCVPPPAATAPPAAPSSAARGALQTNTEETAPSSSHIIDVQSVKDEEVNSAEKDEEEEEENEPEEKEEKEKTGTQDGAAESSPASDEGEEVSLDFETFLHNDGTLYSCFNQQGARVYVDMSQNLQPFPKEWYDQGRFITSSSEVPGHLQTLSSVEPTVREDDRTGSVYIQGKGTVITYMFEERQNVCRFWDPQSGVWLLLPLQWEMNMDFVDARVRRVMSTLPGLVDQKEITAALRQCNYDHEEVISVYLAMFGDILLQAPPSGDRNYADLNSFRALLERDRVIEDLRQKLQTKEKDVDNLFQRNSYLSREVHYLSDVVQHLNQKMAELETDKQEAREKIKSLLNRPAPAVPPARAITKPTLDADHLRHVRHRTRDLNVSNKKLRSTVQQAMGDMRNQLEQIQGVLGNLAQVEKERAGGVEELRSLYRREAVERKRLYNKLLELQGNIRVFCRCRKSSAVSSSLEKTDDQEVAMVLKGSRKKFQFDKVFPQSSTQEEVFEGTLPLILSCVDGYNVCILAYGQTGSGKTYTMMGNKENPGVNIRSIRELLRICDGNQKISYTLKNDLLAKNTSPPLDIRVQGKSVTVPGLTRIQVQTQADILGVMETGEKNRKIASTKMNIQSSRSHLVVVLEVEGSDEVSGLTSRGTLTLCDLAGSERLSRTEAEGQRLVEAAAINKSLTALGQVFTALKTNALHVPFRNSKLTLLLQPCLSGDAKCCVFINVSPDVTDELETISTLQFGSSIRQVTLGRTPQNILPAKPHKVTK